MPKVKYVLKIQHASGKFSKGGGNPRFTREGKAWTDRRALACHLALVREANGGRLPKVYQESRVVLFESVGSQPMEFFDA